MAKVKIVYLPKVGIISDLTSKLYRPIGPSFLLKTLKRLVDRYIRDNLSVNQYAYRPGKLMGSVMIYMNMVISKPKKDKTRAVATFRDVEDAFNVTTDTPVKAGSTTEVRRRMSMG